MPPGDAPPPAYGFVVDPAQMTHIGYRSSNHSVQFMVFSLRAGRFAPISVSGLTESKRAAN